jgi:hypothetical protein
MGGAPAEQEKDGTREENGGAQARDVKPAATALTTVLKGFAATLSQHTERQSNLIDVFGAALRELGAELQKSKTKSFSLEVRLREAEARIAALEKIMGAWTRQGQGWLQ